MVGCMVFMFGSANLHYYVITADFKNWSISLIRSANRRITGRRLEKQHTCCAVATHAATLSLNKEPSCASPPAFFFCSGPLKEKQHVHNYHCRQRGHSCRGAGTLWDLIPAHIWRDVGKTPQRLPVRAETNKPFTLTFTHNTLSWIKLKCLWALAGDWSTQRKPRTESWKTVLDSDAGLPCCEVIVTTNPCCVSKNLSWVTAVQLASVRRWRQDSLNMEV